MIPRTIVARPDELAPRTDPDILPLPGARHPDREAFAPPRSPAAAPGSLEITPRDILNALRFHSVLFVTLGLLMAAGLGALAWYFVPAKFSTYATLLVEQRDPVVLPRAGDDGGRGDFVTFLKTQAKLLSNRKIVSGALLDAKNGIAQLPMLKNESDPAAFLEEKLQTEVSESNAAIKVMLTGEDPQQITRILNTVVDFYINEVNAWRRERHMRIEVLEKSKREVQDLLSKKLKHFEDEFPVSSANEGATAKQRMRLGRFLFLTQQRAAYQSNLVKVRDEHKEAQARLEQFDARPPVLKADELAMRLEQEPNLKLKDAKLTKIRRDIEGHERQSSDPNSPKLHEMRSRLVQEQEEYETLKRKILAAVETEYRAAFRAKYQAEVEKALDEVHKHEALELATVRELEEYKEFKELDESAIQKKMSEHVQQKDDIDRYRTQLNQIDSTIMRLRVDLDAPDRVRIWHKAEVPQKPEIKKQMAVTGFASLAGLGLVGGCISLYELKRRRVFGPSDPLFRQRLPLVGCLPVAGAIATHLPGESLGQAERAYFEAIDKVKTMLCRQMQRRRMQVLLVTSANPEEGKSALAWNLALSMARTDKRTLFIDGNLHNPGLHNIFEIASHPGLSEYLRGERSAPEVIQRTTLENLWCLAAGVCDDPARQALDKDVMRQLLDRCRRDYDFVIIDACSLREAVDPLYLAQRADATILSARSYESRTPDLERAVARLSQLGTPLLGAVLSDPTAQGWDF